MCQIFQQYQIYPKYLDIIILYCILKFQLDYLNTPVMCLILKLN